MGKIIVFNIVREICEVIWIVFNLIYFKILKFFEEWKKIVDGFEEEWNFFYCFGLIDGKYIMIECFKM